MKKNCKTSRDRLRAHAAVILSLLMMLSLFGPAVMHAGTGMDSLYSYAASQSSGDYEYTVSGGTVTLTAYTGKDAAPKIPSKIDGKSVTAIGPECFRGNIAIKKISIPEGITEIGDYAFEACSAASELKLPSTLRTIGKGAFSGDAQLEKLEIPSGVQKIDDGAFLYCMHIESITGGSGVTELGQFAFAGCNELKTVDISSAKNLTVLPDRAFCNCGSLADVKLPETLESLGKRAFSNCEMLEKLSFGPDLKSVGDYCFEKCSSLSEVCFDVGSKGLRIGEKAFTEASDGETGLHLMLPDNTEISADTIADSSLKGLYIYGDGSLKSDSVLTIKEGQLCTDNGTTLVRMLEEKYDPDAEKWVSVIEKADGSGQTRVAIPEGFLRIGPDAFSNKFVDNLVIPASVKEIDDKAFCEAFIRSVSLSDGNSRYVVIDGQLLEKNNDPDSKEEAPSDEGGDAADKEEAGSEGTAAADKEEAGSEGAAGDKYRLIRFFHYKMENGARVRTTRAGKEQTGEDDSAGRKRWIYDFPDHINEIAPYAFYGSFADIEIPESTSLKGFGRLSFANSGIEDPRATDHTDRDYYDLGVISIPDKVLNAPDFEIAENAFTDVSSAGYDAGDDEEDTYDDAPDLSPDEPEDLEDNDRFRREDDNAGEAGDEEPADEEPEEEVKDPELALKSFSGDKSLYTEEAYSSFRPIPNSEFAEWSKEYLDYFESVNGISLTSEELREQMPYTMLYKGEAHYRSMVSVLNHDAYKTEYAIQNTGDDYAPMYTMMDHGLEAELKRSGVQENIVLYSGITIERAADIAGISDGSNKPKPTEEQLINAIGREYTDPAFMSTTTDPLTAFNFSPRSQTIVVIYASKKSLSQLGAVTIDAFTGWGGGEYEVLFNLGARFKVIDAGTANFEDGVYMGPDEKRTYIRLQLLEDPVIVYDLNGGSYNGSKEDITEEHKAGETIRIHESPVRKGYTFSHWEGSEYMPGDEYKVSEDHKFTAVWVADNNSDNDSDNDSNEGSGKDKKSRGVRTGDDRSIAGWMILMLAAAALEGGIVYSRRRR